MVLLKQWRVSLLGEMGGGAYLGDGIFGQDPERHPEHLGHLFVPGTSIAKLPES